MNKGSFFWEEWGLHSSCLCCFSDVDLCTDGSVSVGRYLVSRVKVGQGIASIDATV